MMDKIDGSIERLKLYAYTMYTVHYVLQNIRSFIKLFSL